MRSSELLSLIEEVLEKIDEHEDTWRSITNQHNIDNTDKYSATFKSQSRWLTRELGKLRPYIERFDKNWRMTFGASPVDWDIIDEAVSVNVHSPAKGLSLRAVIVKLESLAGRLSNLGQDDDIPFDSNMPIRSGLSTDNLMIAYLQYLHPVIAKGCSGLFVDGYYAQAVEESAKAVSQHLRDVSGLDMDGAALATQVFSVKKPILAFGDLSNDSIKNEQLGFMKMLEGLAIGVRNPLTHTHGKEEGLQKAFEYLVMASLYCRRIDDTSLV